MKPTRSNLENILLVILLIFAPLALGSKFTWSYCVIAFISLAIFDLHFLNNIDHLKKVLKQPISIGFVLFLVLTFFYIIPFPAQIIKTLSPAAFDLREKYMLNPSLWQTLSLYPRATVEYIIKITSYLMIFLVIVSKIKTTDDRRPTTDDHRPQTYTSFIFLGALTSILSILFHSLVDFNLHIPANALYFTVMLAIVAGLTTKDCESRTTNHEPRTCDHSFLSMLVSALITTGFIIAVFSIIQKLSYNEKIYWIVDVPGAHFGPYTNYDHFAGFMEMCTILAVANFISRVSNSSFYHLRKIKDKILWFSTREANKALVYLFISIVMATALFMSTSRGGIMSFIAALTVFYFVCVISAGKRRRKRILLATLSVIILAIVMILWVGPEETIDRFKGLGSMVRFFIKEKSVLSELRPHFWKDTLQLIKDFPVFGTGLGTYFCVFPKYRTFVYYSRLLTHAHNDYLQAIAEMGVFGLIFILAFFGWYFRKFRYCYKELKRIG